MRHVLDKKGASSIALAGAILLLSASLLAIVDNFSDITGLAVFEEGEEYSAMAPKTIVIEGVINYLDYNIDRKSVV